jgi:hypothetical protein
MTQHGFARGWKALGDYERMLNVEERKVAYRAVNPKPIKESQQGYKRAESRCSKRFRPFSKFGAPRFQLWSS